VCEAVNEDLAGRVTRLMEYRKVCNISSRRTLQRVLKIYVKTARGLHQSVWRGKKRFTSLCCWYTNTRNFTHKAKRLFYGFLYRNKYSCAPNYYDCNNSTVLAEREGWHM